MGSPKPLLRCLAGEAIEPRPVWLMRQAGRYLPEYRALRAQAGSFLDLCLHPARAAEVTLQPLRRFGLDAAILFADILLLPRALGQDLTFAEGEGPRLAPVVDAAGLARLRPEGAVERLAPVYEAVARVKAGLPQGAALIGFAGAPWTVATYMVEGRGSADHKAARLWAYRDPAGFDALIDLLTGLTTDYLSAQITAGAEVVQLFDSWAGSLDAAGFARWSLAPIAAIADGLKRRHPGVPIIVFPRGAGAGLEAVARLPSIDAVSLDANAGRSWARRSLSPHAVLQGNVDPLRLVAGGAGLEADLDDLLSAFAGVPHIVNLGHGIVPETPPEHVAALIDIVRRFGRGDATQGEHGR
ncbi:MAG: uroporphyrinogen decarboxylase [Alphaproteobacteria bacterium]|nr:uroporphyrinogen decarboxylase [Alphaproteobacteria bacterium]